MPVSRVTRTPIYQLKVTLCHSRPTIWRRVEVQSTITLPRLHTALQAVMGWLDEHLHVFVVDGVQYGDPDLIEEFEGEDYWWVRLRQVAPRVGARLAYWYDWGDDWCHDLVAPGWAAGSIRTRLAWRAPTPGCADHGRWGRHRLATGERRPGGRLTAWVLRSTTPCAVSGALAPGGSPGVMSGVGNLNRRRRSIPVAARDCSSSAWSSAPSLPPGAVATPAGPVGCGGRRRLYQRIEAQAADPSGVGRFMVSASGSLLEWRWTG